MQIVTSAVIVRGGKVLLARRGPGGALGGKWEFPGGKLEDDEHPEDGLKRELMEELAMEVRVDTLIGTTEFSNGPKRYALRTYRVTPLTHTPTACEHEEIRWVPVDELERYDLADSDRSMLPRIRSALEGA